jgi:ATP-dependent helicase/nuclease subunit B
VLALPQALRPSPVPPPDLLPKRLSITEIATLRRDPYAIYAKRILAIDPLEPVNRPVMASDLGSAIHEALGRFTQAYPLTLPPSAFDELLQRGREAFAPLSGEAEFQAFWWPRYLRIVQWFLDFDTQHRAQKSQIFAEVSGLETIHLAPDVHVDVHGRADRIEQHRDGTFSLYDFKTGRVPTAKEIRAKLEPQLTITTALLQKGAFAKISNRQLRDFDYIKLGGDEGGSASELAKKLTDIPLDDLVSQHWDGLHALITAHWLQGRGFISRLYPPHRDRFGPYDHLARVKEWTLGEQEGEL